MDKKIDVNSINYDVYSGSVRLHRSVILPKIIKVYNFGTPEKITRVSIIYFLQI